MNVSVDIINNTYPIKCDLLDCFFIIPSFANNWQFDVGLDDN